MSRNIGLLKTELTVFSEYLNAPTQTQALLRSQFLLMAATITVEGISIIVKIENEIEQSVTTASIILSSLTKYIGEY